MPGICLSTMFSLINSVNIFLLSTSTPPTSFSFQVIWLRKQPGIRKTTHTKNTTKTYSQYSFLCKNLGRAIPTAKAPLPSGLPYFMKFSLAFSSVKMVYALVIQMNSLTACGLSGFLSGCFSLESFLQAFFTWAFVAFSSTPKSS